MFHKLLIGIVLCVIGAVAPCQAAESGDWPTFEGDLQWETLEETEQTAADSPQEEALAETEQTTEAVPVEAEEPIQEQEPVVETEETPPETATKEEVEETTMPEMEEEDTTSEMEEQVEQETKALPGVPTVVIKTSMGDLHIELLEEEAPNTVKNFLRYVNDQYYNGTVFHRVIDGFMIQGGGFDKEFNQKDTHEAISNEADNGVKNDRGTVAMARTMEPHSATAQFFINVSDNAFLNFRSKTHGGYGYCVFGRVTTGMDVVDTIRQVKTGSQGQFQDVPVKPIEIIEVSVVK